MEQNTKSKYFSGQYNKLCPKCHTRSVVGELDGWIDIEKCEKCLVRKPPKKRQYAKDKIIITVTRSSEVCL